MQINTRTPIRTPSREGLKSRPPLAAPPTRARPRTRRNSVRRRNAPAAVPTPLKRVPAPEQQQRGSMPRSRRSRKTLQSDIESISTPNLLFDSVFLSVLCFQLIFCVFRYPSILNVSTKYRQTSIEYPQILQVHLLKYFQFMKRERGMGTCEGLELFW